MARITLQDFIAIVVCIATLVTAYITYASSKDKLNQASLKAITIESVLRKDIKDSVIPKQVLYKPNPRPSDFDSMGVFDNYDYLVSKVIIINTTGTQINPEDYAEDIRIISKGKIFAANANSSNPSSFIYNSENILIGSDPDNWRLPNPMYKVRKDAPRLFYKMDTSKEQIAEIKSSNSNSISLGRPLMKPGDYFILDIIMSDSETPIGRFEFKSRIKNADINRVPESLESYNNPNGMFSFMHSFISIAFMCVAFMLMSYIPIAYLWMDTTLFKVLYIVYLTSSIFSIEFIADYLIKQGRGVNMAAIPFFLPVASILLYLIIQKRKKHNKTAQ